MPGGDLPGWRLRFADDFTTDVPTGAFPAAVASRWSAYQDRADTSGRGLYAPDHVLSQHDGLLDWHMRTLQGQPMVSAALPMRGAAQSYGRYAVRFRSDPLPGYKVAWLLWPTGSWPGDGEIDFPEGDLDSSFCGYVHHQGATSGTDQDAFCGLGVFSTWHTAVIEWSPGLVELILDGRVVGRTTDRVPSGPMFWVLQSETSLGAAPSPSTSGHILLDWAVMWSRAG
jgi:beta-glucanase (GH16 family)